MDLIVGGGTVAVDGDRLWTGPDENVNALQLAGRSRFHEPQRRQSVEGVARIL